ncbi:MAG: hypothetical protein WCV81_04615 [Microgenomates group bacterium]|jgi:hypothetical protein
MAIAEHESASVDSPPALSIPKKPFTPQESKNTVPTSSRSWGDNLHLAEFSHNYVNASTNCNNIVSVVLVPRRFTKELTFCKGCKQPIISNLAKLCEELNLDSLRATLIHSTLNHQRDMKQEIRKYRKFVKAQKKSAERLRQSCLENGWWNIKPTSENPK